MEMTEILRFLESFAQPIRALFFLGFVVLGIGVRFAPAGRRRFLINSFLGYALAVNFFVVFFGTDGWPFSPYPMMATDATDDSRILNGLAFRLVYDDGVESRIDPLAFSPLYPQSVMGWLENHAGDLGAEEREEALRFLFARANAARERRLETGWFGNRRIVGPLGAPDTNLYWQPPLEPSDPIGLRIYRFHWNPSLLLHDPTSYSRELIFEYVAKD